MTDDPIVTLEDAEYWELQAKAERVARAELVLAQAQEARTALLRRLADRYGLDLTRDYRLEDATHRLITMPLTGNGRG